MFIYLFSLCLCSTLLTLLLVHLWGQGHNMYPIFMLIFSSLLSNMRIEILQVTIRNISFGKKKRHILPCVA
jgi:hypothetical protein